MYTDTYEITIFFFVCFYLGSNYVVLVVRKLTFADQTGLELELTCLCFSSAEIKGIYAIMHGLVSVFLITNN